MLLAIIGIVCMNYLNQRKLAQMQDVGAKRAQLAVDVKEASMGGLALYYIIADALIDRKLDKTEKDWAKKKTEVLKYFDQVIEKVELPEEKQQAEGIRTAVLEFVRIFEEELLPALKSTSEMTPEIRELHVRIDTLVTRVESGMDRVVDSLQKNMKTADEEFDANVKSATIQGLIIGLIGILLQAWLANWLLRKDMDRRIEELATTRSRVMQLEGLIPICMYCKKIRDDQDSWHQLEKYFAEHSDTRFTHGMCPECFNKHMEEIKKEYP